MISARLAPAAIALLLAGCIPEKDPAAPFRPHEPPPYEPPPQCTDGQTSTQACGACGQAVATCSGGTWGPYSACTGEGFCTAWSQQSESCGNLVGACTAGARTRFCSGSCTWGEWGACSGGVGPVDEICANGVDDDCDGQTDEDCASVYVSGLLAKLVASPDGSVVYALSVGAPPAVVVLDAATHSEVARVVLPQQANDIDLSPNGQHLVVSHDAVHQISKVDVASRTLLFTRPVASDPYEIEVDDAGTIYYVEWDQWVDIHRVNAAVDLASDTTVGGVWPLYEADIELSPDGAFLYGGEGGLSGSNVKKIDVATGTAVDESTWDGGYGFPYPERGLYLGPDGTRLYYAYHQLDPSNLAYVIGGTPSRILAEDRAGTLAVGTRAVLDARTLRHVSDLSRAASCATFANGDAELWYYHGPTGRIFWIPKASLGDASLGSRALPAEPLSSYAISRLVRDPGRARLYGVDPERGVVVAIDSDTLAPLGAILVGSFPTDLAVSLAGDALYVGSFDMLAVARIDLGTFTFDRFIPVPRLPYEIEPLSGGRLAFIDEDQWTTPGILDPATGTVVADPGWSASVYAASLAATANGNWLFVGEGGLSGSNLYLYDVSQNAFTFLLRTTYDGGYGFPYPPRGFAIVPDGSAVYYAGYLIDGSNLVVLRYAQPDRIFTVTPDGVLAASGSKVYRVSDGALLGTLPASSAVQAVSADSATLYLSTPGAITKVDLGAYRTP